jgi:hypothetical protein
LSVAYKMSKKNIFFLQSFLLVTFCLEGTITSVFKDKKSKSHKRAEIMVSLTFLLVVVRPKTIRIDNPAYFLCIERMSFLARSVSVPKSWFLHFYIFSSLYIPALLYLGRYSSSGPARLFPALMFPARLDNSALYLARFVRQPVPHTLVRHFTMHMAL